MTTPGIPEQQRPNCKDVSETIQLEKTKRPEEVPSRTIRVETVCGHIYVTVAHLDNKIFEVFVSIGGIGTCEYAQLSALTVAITMGIRHGVPVSTYIKKLRGIQCLKPTFTNGKKYMSCADAIAQVLEQEEQHLKTI